MQSNQEFVTKYNDELNDITMLVNDVCASAFCKLCFNFTDKCWSQSTIGFVSGIDKSKCDITDFVMSQNSFIEECEFDGSSHFMERDIVINSEKIQHFAGMPLTLFNGDIIGAICVMNAKSQKLSSYQKSLLALIASDIAAKIEKAQKQHELHEMAKLRETFNIELDDFIYIASHDLKSPLNAIKNLISWVEEDSKNGVTEDNPKHFKMIKNSVNRMNLILDGLGEYTRVSQAISTAESVNLAELVADRCKVLDVIDGFTFKVDDCVMDLPKYHLDLILTHLISNAVKHHDKGGGHITISCQSNVNDYILSVIDDGPGIPLDQQEKIFKPFRTLKSKDEMESSGLGLAIVRKIMMQYSGDVFVESTIGLGTNFTVIWPKRQNSCR